MPKISIIIPTYNQAEYIEETIQSIQDQTFKDWELIIVDDGSTDQTKEILNKYAFHQFPNIHVFYKENGGTGTALNLGFSKAQGMYYTWIASDNGLYPNALEELNNYLDNHPNCNVVYSECDVVLMDKEGKNKISKHSIKKELHSMQWNPWKFFECYNIGIVWLWRKIVHTQFQKGPCEDYLFFCDLTLNGYGNTFRFFDKNLGWFRRHNKNISARLSREGYKYTKELIKKMTDKRNNTFPKGVI